MKPSRVPLALLFVGACGGDSTSASGADTTGESSATDSSPSTEPATTDDPATTADTTAQADTTGPDPDAAQILLHFGDDVPEPVRTRVTDHVSAVATLEVVVVDAGNMIEDPNPGSWILAFGENPSTRELITADEIGGAPSETVILRSGEIAGVSALVTDARPLDPDPIGHASLGQGGRSPFGVSATLYGAYAVRD